MHQAPSTTHQAQSTNHKEQRDSDSEVLVRVENLGKIFCRDLKKSLWYGLKDGMGELVPGLKGRQYDANGDPILREGEFWSNQGINFELRRGECLGLIGHNGAGKTTLLKMLNGLIKPDVGKITKRGRVGAIIALGAGFNPVLTGKENVYIAGSVYGLSRKEIDAKYEEIVEFAELEDFMESPVQNYSSGMQVRLGFAVATSIDPDILLIDEVLAVGDRAFRSKAMARVTEKLKNCAVIFVSHHEGQVSRVCTSALWLEKGKIRAVGNTDEILTEYSEQTFIEQENDFCCSDVVRATALNFSNQILRGESCNLELEFELNDGIALSNIAVGVFSSGGEICLRSDVWIEPRTRGRITLTIENLQLKTGQYNIVIDGFDSSGRRLLFELRNMAPLNISRSDQLGQEDLISCVFYQPVMLAQHK